MNDKKFLALASLLIILAFIGYIIFDTVRNERKPYEIKADIVQPGPADKWQIAQTIECLKGLKAVAVSPEGIVYAGGESYIVSYNSNLNKIWQIEMPERISALAVNGDTLFAASEELIYLLSPDGKIINDWGPYETKCLITSLSANKDFLLLRAVIKLSS